MTDVFSAERVDPGELSAPKREELSAKLYEIHKLVFAGLNKREFDHYVVNSPAMATRILLYRNKQQELIGYFGVHRFEKHVEGRSIVVFRAEVGMLPGYRQRDANCSFWLTEAAKYKLLHPSKQAYFFYVPVSPSFYAMVARHTHKLYPGLTQKVPSDVMSVMTQLAQEFGLAQAEKRGPLIREVGWITKSTSHETEYWRTSRNPYIRFYIDKNPQFVDGKGLLTLIPLTIANVALSLVGVGFHALKKKIRVNFRQYRTPPP